MNKDRRSTLDRQVNVSLSAEHYAYLEAYGEAFFWKPGTLARILIESWVDEQKRRGVAPATLGPRLSTPALTPRAGKKRSQPR